MIRGLILKLNAVPCVLLGLEPENIARLLAGEPIELNLQHLDPTGDPVPLPDIDVVIFHADPDTAEELMARYRERFN